MGVGVGWMGGCLHAFMCVLIRIYCMYVHALLADCNHVLRMNTS